MDSALGLGSMTLNFPLAAESSAVQWRWYETRPAFGKLFFQANRLSSRVHTFQEGSFYARTTRPAAWLQESLDELAYADAESVDEGWRPASDAAKAHARRVLNELARFASLPAPSVYPTEDGEIAVFFRHREAGASVLLLFDSSGGGACFADIGRKRRARYDDAGDLPDAFVCTEVLRLVQAA